MADLSSEEQNSFPSEERDRSDDQPVALSCIEESNMQTLSPPSESELGNQSPGHDEEEEKEKEEEEEEINLNHYLEMEEELEIAEVKIPLEDTVNETVEEPQCADDSINRTIASSQRMLNIPKSKHISKGSVLVLSLF
jgi:hypothetical protein